VRRVNYTGVHVYAWYHTLGRRQGQRLWKVNPLTGILTTGTMFPHTVFTAWRGQPVKGLVGDPI
jgi:hypothetical protein